MLDLLRSFLRAKSRPSRGPWTNQRPEFARYSIGDWTYGAPIIKTWEQNTTLVIGKYCSIGKAATILLGGEHRTDWLTTFPFAELLPSASGAPLVSYSKGDVVIGHDVWIGTEAMVLSGVTVGSGAVIGARSVVAKSVESYSIVAGNPAQHIRYRIPEHLIPQMLSIAWWDWPHEDVLAALQIILSDKIEEFINRYGSRTEKE
jgi:acetyltransferase-like isoleucine patch superfamily enzyme